MSYANAPIVLNSRDRTGGQYNNSQFNANNQNIIQGDIKEIAVSEVNFPYDIPNVQEGYNTFGLSIFQLPEPGVGAVTEGVLEIVIPPGFYTGPELEAAINLAIIAEVAAGAEAPTDPADAPTFSYDATTNRFSMVKPVKTSAEGNGTPIWLLTSTYTFPGPGDVNDGIGKDLLSIMGYYNAQAQGPIVGPLAAYNIVDADAAEGAQFAEFTSGSAPLAFTQYVDICSPQLCKYQYFRDGSTTNLARRADVICRLFICDNISLTQNAPEGTRPFVINRQYFNARIMRWSTENSVGTIDIQLYDDTGQPLATTYQPRNYQITFNCYERSVNDAEKGEEEGGAPTRFASYQERNVSRAWKNLGRQ